VHFLCPRRRKRHGFIEDRSGSAWLGAEGRNAEQLAARRILRQPPRIAPECTSSARCSLHHARSLPEMPSALMVAPPLPTLWPPGSGTTRNFVSLGTVPMSPPLNLLAVKLRLPSRRGRMITTSRNSPDSLPKSVKTPAASQANGSATAGNPCPCYPHPSTAKVIKRMIKHFVNTRLGRRMASHPPQ